MIMQWKRWPGNDYVAHWQGITYRLCQHEDGRWYLTANDRPVKENWAKSRQAMEMIESRQQKLIIGAMQTGVPVVKIHKFYPDGTCKKEVRIGVGA